MKKRRIITWALVLLVLVVVVLLFIPYQKQISYHGTDYEYSTADPDVAIAHEVVIEGTYIRFLLFDDVFQGTFYISDANFADMGKNVRFTFHNQQCAVPAPMSDYGEPLPCDIAAIYAAPNFTQLAAQFYYHIEQGGDSSCTALASTSESTFLVLGAQSRDEALDTYRALARIS